MELNKNDKARLKKRLGLVFAIVLVALLGIALASVDWKGDQKIEKKPDQQSALPVKYGVNPIMHEPDTQAIAAIHKQEPDVLKIIDHSHSVKTDDKLQIVKEFREYLKIQPINPKEANRLPEVKIKNERVYLAVDEMPKFQGGYSFQDWIKGHTKYPQIAAENGISGKVIVQFAVNSRGEIVDIVVVRSIDPSLDREAVRVISSSPRWSPGRQRGQAVKVQFNVPVFFVLQ